MRGEVHTVHAVALIISMVCTVHVPVFVDSTLEARFGTGETTEPIGWPCMSPLTGHGGDDEDRIFLAALTWRLLVCVGERQALMVRRLRDPLQSFYLSIP